MKIDWKYANLFLLLISISATSPTWGQDSLASIQKRLQVLEDKEAIRTLLQQYGRFVDDRDWESFANLYADNGGTWDGGMGVATGREQIIDMMQNSIGSENAASNGSGYSNLHLLSNEIIEVDGDKGKAVSKWVFVMTAKEGGPDVVFIGRYLDDLVRENGEWKFQKRQVLSDISSPIQLDGLNKN